MNGEKMRTVTEMFFMLKKAILYPLQKKSRMLSQMIVLRVTFLYEHESDVTIGCYGVRTK